MQTILHASGCTLERVDGDKRIGKESTVVFHMRNLLNAQGYNFVRIRPGKYGLTSCPNGLADWKRGIILWHERYAIEDAAEEFNKSKSVWFQRVDDEISHRKLGDAALRRSGVSQVALEVLKPFETDGPDWKLRLDMLREPKSYR